MCACTCVAMRCVLNSIALGPLPLCARQPRAERARELSHHAHIDPADYHHHAARLGRVPRHAARATLARAVGTLRRRVRRGHRVRGPALRLAARCPFHAPAAPRNVPKHDDLRLRACSCVPPHYPAARDARRGIAHKSSRFSRARRRERAERARRRWCCHAGHRGYADARVHYGDAERGGHVRVLPHCVGALCWDTKQ